LRAESLQQHEDPNPDEEAGAMSRMCRALSIATLMLLAGAGLAAAARAPTSSERAIIVTTVKDSRLLSALPRDAIAVTAIRISTVTTTGRRYARARIFDTTLAHPDRATGVLRRLRGHWRLLDLGTADVGCRTVPARVRADL
jgi:hypothetical protein